MLKIIKITLVLLLILFGVSQGFKLINNLDKPIYTYTYNDASTDQNNSANNDKINKETYNKKSDDSHSNLASKENNINSKSSDSNNTTKSNDTKSSDDNHIIAVSSPLYNAVVSLDQNNKEVNIKLVNSEDINTTSYDNYINFEDKEIKYLLENYPNLMKEFKNNNLFEKYDMVSKMLGEYDTDIKESDLISMAISYLK